MDMELAKEGFLIMLIGMGTVFLFLTIMIYVVDYTARFMKIINKYFPEEIKEETAKKQKKSTDNGAEIAIAIACAAMKRGKTC